MKRIALFLFAVCASLSATGCASRRAAPTPKLVTTLPGANWIYLCPGKTGKWVFVVDGVSGDLTGKCVKAKDVNAARKKLGQVETNLETNGVAAARKKQ